VKRSYYSYLSSIFILFFSIITNASATQVKGIYLTQYSLENTQFVSHLVERAKTAGVNTFVIDLEKPSKRYQQNIQIVTQSGIRYVARIVMFPDGGTAEQINNQVIWQKKYQLAKQAIAWGASEIQLDYIRYNTKTRPSPENAKNILKILQWYKSQLASQQIPLQIDVFGITSFGESSHIGQNIQLFASSIDAICPMVYPSHFVPFPQHFATPYETVYNSLNRVKLMFGNNPPFKIIAYIELSNYHFPMSKAKTLEYIKAQIRAVKNVGAEGWFAWSPHNKYENLFTVLQSEQK
jgi:hypothetical protein